MSKPTGFICGPRLYEYGGWFFEFSMGTGPWPLKKDGELRERAGRVFYNMFDKFSKLPKTEQESYRVGGGCQRF